VLAEAALLLLRAALQDASNVHFAMVSDTSVPLYPPQVRSGEPAGTADSRKAASGTCDM
jgi:hypothetical protein